MSEHIFCYDVDYLSYWKKQNNLGETFAIGQDSEDINEIETLAQQGYKLEIPARSDNQVSIYRHEASNEVLIVGDTHGPMACVYK